MNDESSFVEFKESSAPGGSKPTGDKKPLPGSGVNLYDPAATASHNSPDASASSAAWDSSRSSRRWKGARSSARCSRTYARARARTRSFRSVRRTLGLVASDSRVGGGATPKRGDFTGVNVVIANAETGDVYVDTKKTKRPNRVHVRTKAADRAGVSRAGRGRADDETRRGSEGAGAAQGGLWRGGVVLSDGTRVPPNGSMRPTITLEEGEQLVPVSGLWGAGGYVYAVSTMDE